MKIGIVNDVAMAAEALRRVVAASQRTRSAVGGARAACEAVRHVRRQPGRTWC